MNKQLLLKAQTIIKELKNNNERIAKQNEFLAMQNVSYKNNSNKIREIKFEIGKLLAQQKNAKELENKLNKLEIEQKAILFNDFGNNFSVLPKINCNKCNDTGECENKICDCVKKEMSKILIKISGINHPLADFLESNFDMFNENKDKMKDLFEKMKNWCDNYRTKRIKNITFLGNAGSGKSFLTECMAKRLIDNGNYVLFTTAFNLNNNFLKYHTTFDDSKVNFLQPFLDCDILLIDDLGTEPMLKNVTREYLVLNERIANNSPTIITSNLCPEKLREIYEDRVFSRIINKNNSALIEIINDDNRLKPNKS
ncbi:MAG: ATP-binding protein [Clostridia bacterium]